MSDAGRGLHATRTVTSPKMRRQIIQQLLVGDLADLADEGLYKLLPGGYAGKRKNRKRWHALLRSRQQTWKPSLRKKSQASVGKPELAEDTLCYVSLKERVFHQLKQSHSENHLAQTLRDVVFLELNLRSYLDCKSDLALSTIRHILRGRPTDEAFELDQSLTKALMSRWKTSKAKKQSLPTAKHAGQSPAAVPWKSQSHTYLHPWLSPMEWED